VNCLEYCPQEIITREYKGNKTLILRNFKWLIKSLPLGLPISFAGVSEPFQNQECTDMIEYAHALGHPLIVFTTLYGLKPEDAERIINMRYLYFTLHMPDACGVSKIPRSKEYYETLDIILTGTPNLSFMSMNDNFVTDRNEYIHRNLEPVRIHGRAFCEKHETPNYIMMPNGDVHFCCQTKGCCDRIGNLYAVSYPGLVNRFHSNSKRMQLDPSSICHKCSIASPYYKYIAGKAMRKLSALIKPHLFL